MPHYKSGVGYTILNSFYFDALGSLVDELQKEDIPYAIVGGAAFQLRIADVLSGQGTANIKGMGLDAMLRPTGDIDLDTISDYGQMVYLINMLTLQSPFNAEPQGDKLIRLTRKRIKERKEEDVLHVNYSTQAADFKGLSAHHEVRMRTAEDVFVRKGNERLQARVPTLPYCLATKLLRLEEKDKIDIFLLLNAYRVRDIPFDRDVEETRAILKSVGKEDRFAYIHDIAYELTMPRAPVSLTGEEGVRAIGK